MAEALLRTGGMRRLLRGVTGRGQGNTGNDHEDRSNRGLAAQRIEPLEPDSQQQQDQRRYYGFKLSNPFRMNRESLMGRLL